MWVNCGRALGIFDFDIDGFTPRAPLAILLEVCGATLKVFEGNDFSFPAGNYQENYQTFRWAISFHNRRYILCFQVVRIRICWWYLDTPAVNV